MKRMMTPLLIAAATLLTTAASGAPLKINKGDHISIIGNTLASPDAADGWLETYLQSRFPPLRNSSSANLGFSGDENPLLPLTRLRLRPASDRPTTG